MAEAIVESLDEGTQCTKTMSVFTAEINLHSPSNFFFFFFLRRITCLVFSHSNAKLSLMALLNHPQSISYSDTFCCVCF